MAKVGVELEIDVGGAAVEIADENGLGVGFARGFLLRVSGDADAQGDECVG